jgi:hypothetical protein
MSYDEKAAERVRRVLAGGQDLAEKKMMGAICFMVRGSMCCGITGSALMVRVGREAYQRTLAEPHVPPMEIGGGRRPSGFVLVDRKGYGADAALAKWSSAARISYRRFRRKNLRHGSQPGSFGQRCQSKARGGRAVQ